jgi:hypothetical protein
VISIVRHATSPPVAAFITAQSHSEFWAYLFAKQLYCAQCSGVPLKMARNIGTPSSAARNNDSGLWAAVTFSETLDLVARGIERRRTNTTRLPASKECTTNERSEEARARLESIDEAALLASLQ